MQTDARDLHQRSSCMTLLSWPLRQRQPKSYARAKDSLLNAMSDIQIDVEKSIARRRLTYRVNGWSVMSLILEYCSAFVTITAVPFLLGVLASVSSGILCVLLMSSVAISFAYYLCSIFLLKRLICVGGTVIDENRRRIIQLVSEKYPRYEVAPGRFAILATHVDKLFAFDRTIVVLLDENDIYLNAYTLGRGSIKYLTAAIPNFLLSKKLAREFSNTI